MQRYGWISVILTLADLRRESRGRREAIRFITERLRQRASVRGLDRLARSWRSRTSAIPAQWTSISKS